MADQTNKISRIIREFYKEMGGAIPLADVLRRANAEGITEEEVKQGLEKLQNDGIISRLDEDTIEFL